MTYELMMVTEADASLMLEYLKQVGSESDYLLFGSEGVPMTVDQETAFLKTVNSTPFSRMFVVKYQNQIIGNGYIYANPRKRIQHKAQIAISVLRAFWGQGVSQLLMSALIDYAKSTQFIQTILLEVVTENIRAIRLYEKFGFVAYGKQERAVLVDNRYLDWLLMRLDI